MPRNFSLLILMGFLQATSTRGAEAQPLADINAPRASDLVALLDAPSLEQQLMMHVVRPSPSLQAMEALLKIGPASADALAGALKSDKVNLRVNAVYVLARLGAETNLKLLLPAAKDSAPEVRAMLIRRLVNVNLQVALAVRLAALEDKDASVRLTAVYGFRSFNPLPLPRHPAPVDKGPDNYTLSSVVKSMTPVLLRDSDPQIRAAAAEALGELRNANAVPALISALSDAQLEVRVHAVSSLGQLRQRQAVAPLLKLLDDKEQIVVLAAVEALGDLGDPLATKPLIPLLRHEHVLSQAFRSLPARTARALGQIGDRRAVPALIESLKGPSDDVIAEAAEALGKIGDARAADPLLNTLQTRSDAQPRLLLATATALGQLRDTRAIEALADLLMSKKVEHKPVVEALRKISHPRVVVEVADRLVASNPTPHNPYNNDAAWLLTDITGRSFAFNYDGLKKWWVTNRQTYVDAAEPVKRQE
jgi:HEAT repeat protein